MHNQENFRPSGFEKKISSLHKLKHPNAAVSVYKCNKRDVLPYPIITIKMYKNSTTHHNTTTYSSKAKNTKMMQVHIQISRAET